MNNEKIERMVRLGYTVEDAIEISKLEKQFDEECEEIAKECELEWFPVHGENYELRCENARQYYDEKISLIDYGYNFEEA